MESQEQKNNFTVVSIEDEMRGAYLDYAMSVIVGRALPDFRDGLKPVHRRVLYAMHELNNYHDKPYKKSARVVGDVIGKYHPHGDSAVYYTIVRLAQDFSMRYQIVDGQGNFGSIDGDSPAAMRYTEVRLARVAQEFLSDLDKETVDFTPNYDGTLKEPVLMPSKIPNYLVNGSSGIAVGMATSVPPHNLSEIVKGVLAVIENPEISIPELMNIIPGPDFPTHGIIYGREGIVSAYNTGRGVIRIRAKAEIEEDKKGNEKVVVTEIPYQVNKARLIEKIAELVKEKRIEGVSDIRDESSRIGIRVVVDVRKGFQGNVILNQLYKFTQMEDSFGIIMLGLDNNQPKVFNLKQYLVLFVEYRKEIIVRRTRFLLRKAEEKAHLLLGLKTAVENIDEVVATIKAASSPLEAKSQLISKFSMSDIQAQAVLDLKLQRLTALERDKIISEYKELLAKIEELKGILNDDQKVIQIIKEELVDIEKNYGDKRRTEIVATTDEIDVEDLIPNDEVVVITTHSGYIKRMSVESFREQRRGGKGVKGQDLKDDDEVSDIFTAKNHNYLLCFSSKGKCYWLKIYQIPMSTRGTKGKHIANLLTLENDEKVVATLPVSEFSEHKNIIMVSEKGIIKKTSLMNFSRPRSGGIIAVNTDEGDFIETVQMVSEGDHILISTRKGKSICFSESDVTRVGRTARGVKGVNLGDGDIVVGVDVLNNIDSPDYTIMTVFENGYGKRTDVSEFRVQSRGGKGVMAGKVGEKGGSVVTVFKVKEDDSLMLVSDGGQTIRINVKDIRVMGRSTQGVRLMNLDGGEKIVGVAKIISENNAGAVPDVEGNE
jgi:DNA gyrase subunit A